MEKNCTKDWFRLEKYTAVYGCAVKKINNIYIYIHIRTFVYVCGSPLYTVGQKYFSLNFQTARDRPLTV